MESTSYVSGLYDTCESKPRMKNGDTSWKPRSDLVTASEAKQMSLERGVQSLKSALHRVSVPSAFVQSGYWNGGFERRVDSLAPDPPLLVL